MVSTEWLLCDPDHDDRDSSCYVSTRCKISHLASHRGCALPVVDEIQEDPKCWSAELAQLDAAPIAKGNEARKVRL